MPFNFNFVPFLALYMCQSNPSRGTFSWGQKNHEHAVASELNARVRTCQTRRQFSSPIQYYYYYYYYNIDGVFFFQNPVHLSFLLLPYSSHFFSFLQSAASMEGLASLRVPFQTTQFHSSRPRTSILPSQAIFFHKRSSFSSFSASAQVRFFLYHFATFYRVFLCINMGLSRFFVLGVGG